MVVEFKIPMEARPTPRPKVAKNGGVYLPAPYPAYFKDLQTCIKDQYFDKAIDPNQPVEVLIEVCKRTNPGYTTFGDVDNLAKGILDAMEGIVYKNDSLVTKLTIEKIQEKYPCINIYISQDT